MQSKRRLSAIFRKLDYKACCNDEQKESRYAKKSRHVTCLTKFPSVLLAATLVDDLARQLLIHYAFFKSLRLCAAQTLTAIVAARQSEIAIDAQPNSLT